MRARDVPPVHTPWAQPVGHYRNAIPIPHTPRFRCGVIAFVAFAFLNAALWTTVARLHSESSADDYRNSAVTATVTGYYRDNAIVRYDVHGRSYDKVFVDAGTTRNPRMRVVPDPADPQFAQAFIDPGTASSSQLVGIVVWTVLGVGLAALALVYRRNRIHDGRWNEYAYPRDGSVVRWWSPSGRRGRRAGRRRR